MKPITDKTASVEIYCVFATTHDGVEGIMTVDFPGKGIMPVICTEAAGIIPMILVAKLEIIRGRWASFRILKFNNPTVISYEHELSRPSDESSRSYNS